jgi:hypothetical protein
MEGSTTLADELRVRRVEEVLSQESGQEGLLVDQRSGTVHVINATAVQVWELCADEPSLGTLIAAVAAHYGVERELVDADVRELVRTFSGLGVVELIAPA